MSTNKDSGKTSSKLGLTTDHIIYYDQSFTMIKLVANCRTIYGIVGTLPLMRQGKREEEVEAVK